MRYELKKFEKFLKEVNLDGYRERFSKIKTVEMDLPKAVQALNAMYKIYWDEDDETFKNPPQFDEFYQYYYEDCKNAIEDFWNKSGFGTECECFPRGLKARIYRTWASIITQIHAGYVAESVFGVGTIKQGTEIDHKGVDILVNYKQNEIKIQIKKDSKRPEINRMIRDSKPEGGIYDIWYVVPTKSDYENPYYKIKSKVGQLRDSVKNFVKYNPKNGTLNRLDNGFVIFTSLEFELIKNKIDNSKK